MFKNALVSVADKTGLVEFLEPFVGKGLRLVSTGGTARFLREAGFEVMDVSTLTGHPEVMDGRVKTLHPRVHMSLLARLDQEEDQEELRNAGIEPFDLVVCNLYPFAATAEKYLLEQSTWDELIEQIDVGGPSMLRAAAKNHKFVTVVCDPADYSKVSGPGDLQARKNLAVKVFSHTASYDSMIASAMGGVFRKETGIMGREVPGLRYGENPHQKAAWYAETEYRGIHTAKIIQGKALSYNNILDLDAAVKICSTLKKSFAKKNIIAIKHNNPCGAALGNDDLSNVAKRSIASDPISVFGGIVAVSEEVDEATAKVLGEVFLECVMAPGFSEKALAVFATKKNLRVLAYPKMLEDQELREIRTVSGGFLQQYVDSNFGQSHDWQWSNPTLQKSAEKGLIEDLKFAEIMCAFLKSNAICIVKSGQVLGMGMGQVNRVDAVKQAIERMHQHHGKIDGTILASDAFFPFADSMELAAQARIGFVLQPGGSVRDAEVMQVASNNNITTVLTGIRHFKH